VKKKGGVLRRGKQHKTEDGGKKNRRDKLNEKKGKKKRVPMKKKKAEKTVAKRKTLPGRVVLPIEIWLWNEGKNDGGKR